jgi:hypothetical protein
MSRNFAYLKNLINLKKSIINGMKYSFIFGFNLGLLPNTISISYNEKKFNRIPTPLIGGCVGLTSFLFSPFLLVNYFCGGVYFDKLYDKYKIDIKRYHQYDGSDNKYAFPSLIIINILSNKNNNKQIENYD